MRCGHADSLSSSQNDMLQWVLEEAVPRGHTDFKIAERIMILNFVAIHTSSAVRRYSSQKLLPALTVVLLAWQSISHALLHLAAEPKYLQPLREEVESIVAAEGWTKAAMGKMWKIDSFLKESQRVNGVALSMFLTSSTALTAAKP